MAHQKVARYTILNRFYFDALKVLTDELNFNYVPNMVVGGTAYQLKMAELIAGKGGNLNSVSAGLEAFLRQTGDIDLQLRAEEMDMIRIFNGMAASTSSLGIQNLPNRALHVTKGGNIVQVSYNTKPSDFRGMTEFYDHMIDTADEVVLKRGNTELRAHIPHLDYLLASKMIRMKEKDKVDISNLLNVCKSKNLDLDSKFESTRRILKFLGKEDNFDYINQTAYGC
ncbi:MAG: hypothetical protein Q8Q01_01355 [archaeon]|nr:hypothetical protein [archaeon]